jgi:hypothetical protein
MQCAKHDLFVIEKLKSILPKLFFIYIRLISIALYILDLFQLLCGFPYWSAMIWSAISHNRFLMFLYFPQSIIDNTTPFFLRCKIEQKPNCKQVNYEYNWIQRVQIANKLIFSAIHYWLIMNTIEFKRLKFQTSWYFIQ